jgi:hypothetical protein
LNNKKKFIKSCPCFLNLYQGIKMAALALVRGQIGTYDYAHGNTTAKNRRIVFSRIGTNAGTIQAEVYVLNLGIRGALVSTLSDSAITVEMEGTAAKLHALVSEKKSEEKLETNKPLSKLTYGQQDVLMQDLQSKYIEVVSAGDEVESLNIVSS